MKGYDGNKIYVNDPLYEKSTYQLSEVNQALVYVYSSVVKHLMMQASYEQNNINDLEGYCDNINVLV